MLRNRRNQRLPRRRRPRPLLSHRRVLQLPPPLQARKKPRLSGLWVCRLSAWSVLRIGGEGGGDNRLQKKSVGAPEVYRSARLGLFEDNPPKKAAPDKAGG